MQWSYDLGAWAFPPGTPANRRSFPQGAVWAAVRGGVLYVSTAHSTFAADSRGRTAYVRAIDLATSRVRWSSRALVANADTFVITSGVIVTGYGFTDEPDRLVLLDVKTGLAVDDLAVPSAPEYIALQRGALLVRTYDHDLVVRLGRGSLCGNSGVGPRRTSVLNADGLEDELVNAVSGRRHRRQL